MVAKLPLILTGALSRRDSEVLLVDGAFTFAIFITEQGACFVKG